MNITPFVLKTLTDVPGNKFATSGQLNSPGLFETDHSARAEQKRKNALNWLYSRDFEETHTQIGSMRQKDTGGWLLRHQNFQKLVGGDRVVDLFGVMEFLELAKHS